ncbi:MAG: peptidase M1 [Ignavibacteria bacterium]
MAGTRVVRGVRITRVLFPSCFQLLSMQAAVRCCLVLWLCAVECLAQHILPPANGTAQDMYEKELLRSASLMMASYPAIGERGFDVTAYRLDLTVSVLPQYLRGIVTLHARATHLALDTMTLDLSSAMTVDSVLCNGTRTTFVQHPATVAIDLDRTYANGEMMVVEVFYHGMPQPTGFGSFMFGSHDGTPWVWTLSEPYGARDWWPCSDHPTDKADSVDILITCPAAFKVASNGKLLGIRSNADGTHTYHWSVRYPIATYLVFLSLTNYDEFTDWFHYTPTDSMPIVNYVLPQDVAAARDSFRVVKDMLRIFSDRFGLYPFINEKYGHAQFGRGGAMEHQTMISLTRAAFREAVLAHELAHHWFGNLITCASWSHLWLNEGFASYAESLFFEDYYGVHQYRQSMQLTMALAKTGRGPLVKSDTTNLQTLFEQATTYRKGASVLHMLRHVVGDSLFFRSLRAFTADPRFRFGTATSEDFQSVCETVAQRSLEWFFRQWLYGENFPRYTYTWRATAENGRSTVALTIRQTTGTSNPSVFVMPIDVRFSSASRETILTLFQTENNQTFQLSLPFRPERVELDPDEWILRDILPPGSDDPIPTAFRLSQNYPNPFNGGTTIPYDIPTRSFVVLELYDVLGRKVRTLVNELQEPGYKRVQLDAANLASGVYVYRLRASVPPTQGKSFASSRTLVVIR